MSSITHPRQRSHKRQHNGYKPPEQINFLEQMRKTGAISGIVRSAKEAIELLNQ